MVADSGKTLRAGVSLRRINLPEPLGVEEDPSGVPVAVQSPRRQVVAAIEDCWQIDDEWWRSEPVARLYYDVLFTSGQKLVLYKDLIDGKWYKQMY